MKMAAQILLYDSGLAQLHVCNAILHSLQLSMVRGFCLFNQYPEK